MALPDLDKSGLGWQRVKINLGPTLGDIIVQVSPQAIVPDAAYTVQPGDDFILLTGNAQTINLPKAALWLTEPLYRPATAFDRSLWFKDFIGNANTFNKT